MPEEDLVDTEVQEPQVIRPPVPLLVVAGACVALSAALLILQGLLTNVVGYALASFVAIALVGMFRRTDLQRRQEAAYMPIPGLHRWPAAVAILGVAVAAVHTWWIATELAK